MWNPENELGVNAVQTKKITKLLSLKVRLFQIIMKFPLTIENSK